MLKYHVLGTKVLSKDVRSGPVGTLDTGSVLYLTADGSGVMVRDGGVNTARVTQADVPASNGVVHVIDAVLVPDALVGAVKAFLLPAPMAASAPEPVRVLSWEGMSESGMVSSVMSEIDSAIAIGAPLYNHGDIEGCARVWRHAA